MDYKETQEELTALREILKAERKAEAALSKETPGPFFIGISGKKQSGKDTAVKILKDYFGTKASDFYFSTPLKEFCVETLNLDRSLVYGSEADKNRPTHIEWSDLSPAISKNRVGHMTVREVLQVFGTDIMRKSYKNIWIDSLFGQDFRTRIVIIGDVRFSNEKKAIESRGGKVIRLERPNNMLDSHNSETELDNEAFDGYYLNDGTLEEFKKEIISIVNLWKTTWQ